MYIQSFKDSTQASQPDGDWLTDLPKSYNVLITNRQIINLYKNTKKMIPVLSVHNTKINHYFCGK